METYNYQDKNSTLYSVRILRSKCKVRWMTFLYSYACKIRHYHVRDLCRLVQYGTAISSLTGTTLRILS